MQYAMPNDFEAFGHGEGTRFIVTYEITPSTPPFAAAAGVSEEYRLSLDIRNSNLIAKNFQEIQIQSGALKQIRAACVSLDFDISLRQKAEVSTPAETINEILKVIHINKFYDEFKLDISFTNNDVTKTPCLYLVVTNNDAVNPIPSFQFELVIDSTRRVR